MDMNIEKITEQIVEKKGNVEEIKKVLIEMHNEIVIEERKKSPVYLGEKKKTISGETFEMGITSMGAYYKTFGGYMVFASPRNESLYEVLSDTVNEEEKYKNLSKKEQENFNLAIAAIAEILNLNTFVFGDAAFMFDTAGYILAYRNEKIKVAMENAEMMMETATTEETEEEKTMNIEYEKTILALDEIKKMNEKE